MEEDISIDESEEFTDVKLRPAKRYPFPTVVFLDYHSGLTAYFNSQATALFDDVERVCVKISKNYAVFLPSNTAASHRITRLGDKHQTCRIGVSGLRGHIPEGNRYRAYPCNGGIAIKRNEPIREDTK